MKLTDTEALVLRQLMIIRRAQDRCGFEIVRRSKGVIPMGSVYVLLGRLEAKGLATSQREELGEKERRTPRRLYQITDAGRSVLRAYRIMQKVAR